MAWSATWDRTEPKNAEEARKKADDSHTKAMIGFWMMMVLMVVLIVGQFVRIFTHDKTVWSIDTTLLLIAVLNGAIASMNFADSRYYRSAFDRLKAA